MRTKIFIIIFGLVIGVKSSLLGMEFSPTSSYIAPVDSYAAAYTSRKGIYDATRLTDSSRGLYERPSTAVKTTYNGVQVRKLAPQQVHERGSLTADQTTIQPAKPTISSVLAQEFLLQEGVMPEHQSQPAQLYQPQPNKYDSPSPMIMPIDAPKQGNDFLDLSDVAKGEILNPSINQDVLIGEAAGQIPAEVTGEVTSKFKSYLHKSLFALLKRSLSLTIEVQLVQLSFADVIAVSLEQLLFQLSNLSDDLAARQDNSINNFKLQIQYLAEQIKNYNNKTTYTQPEQMLLLIKFINRFLKENNIIHFSQEMNIKLNAIEQLATICCNLFKNQNMIFSSLDAPEAILSYFKQSIDNTKNLSNIQFTHNLMHAIYDSNGYIDNIMQNWKNFQTNDLQKNKINRDYAAFLTFLLLFENSIVAAAIILDETSVLYKVTNPIPVYINIA